MALRARVNGQEIESIPVDDRGLAYGDGLFETIAVYQGRPLLLAAHLERLKSGLDALQIFDPPGSDEVRSEIELVSAGIARGVIKLILTLGDGLRGYDPTSISAVRTIVILHPWPEYTTSRKDGMRVGLCKLIVSSQHILARIKHLNRLEQVLARAEWKSDWQEALLKDQQGNVVSDTQSNLFFTNGKTLYTPPIVDCGIAGVMRDAVIRCARQLGHDCEEKILSSSELTEVEQAFMTNSLLGTGPVAELCGRAVKIGPMIRQLQKHLYENQLVVSD